MNLDLDLRVRDLIVDQLSSFNNILVNKIAENKDRLLITNNNLIQFLFSLSIDNSLKDKIQIVEDGIFSDLLENQNNLTFLSLHQNKRDELILALMNNFSFAVLCSDSVDDLMRGNLIKENQHTISFLHSLHPIFCESIKGLGNSVNGEGSGIFEALNISANQASNIAVNQQTTLQQSSKLTSNFDEVLLEQKINDKLLELNFEHERSVNEKMKELEAKIVAKFNLIQGNVYNIYRNTSNLTVTIDNVSAFLNSKQSIKTQRFSCNVVRFFINILPQFQVVNSVSNYLRFDLVCDDYTENKIKWTLEVEIRLLGESNSGIILKYDAKNVERQASLPISRLVKYDDLFNFIKNDSLKLDIFYKRGEIIDF